VRLRLPPEIDTPPASPPPGCIPGCVRGRFSPNPLLVCAAIVDDEYADGSLVRGRIERVLLGDASNSGLAGAKILRAWEGDDAP
jgi:hypothetical protein